MTIFPSAHTPAPRRMQRALALAGGVAGGLLIVLLVVAGAIGWLYLLTHAWLLTVGPDVPAALPLQRLAGGAAQPLLRFCAAWLPAGLVAGLALRAVGFLRRETRAAFVAIGFLALLLVAGAAADAVTASEPLRTHLGPQLHREATWLAAGLAALAAAIPRPRR